MADIDVHNTGILFSVWAFMYGMVIFPPSLKFPRGIACVRHLRFERILRRKAKRQTDFRRRLPSKVSEWTPMDSSDGLRVNLIPFRSVLSYHQHDLLEAFLCLTGTDLVFLLSLSFSFSFPPFHSSRWSKLNRIILLENFSGKIWSKNIWIYQREYFISFVLITPNMYDIFIDKYVK